MRVACRRFCNKNQSRVKPFLRVDQGIKVFDLQAAKIKESKIKEGYHLSFEPTVNQVSKSFRKRKGTYEGLRIGVV